MKGKDEVPTQRTVCYVNVTSFITSNANRITGDVREHIFVQKSQRYVF